MSTFGQDVVRVRVPATSANLGPGYDALGLALALHDQVEARVTPSGVSISVWGEGAELADAGERHLVVFAMRAAFDELGVGQPPGIELRCVNGIPQGRGLGSSAAAISAGILAARALAGAPTGPQDALQLANALEGHPDNVAPCLYGGLTVAWLSIGDPAADGIAGGGLAGGGPVSGGQLAGSATGGAVAGGGAVDWPVAGGSVIAGPLATGSVGGSMVARAVRLAPLPELKPVVMVAPEPVPTEVARGLLPGEVAHADAVANAGRAALLVAALTGGGSGSAGWEGTARPEALLAATEDRLHQDYRAPAMPATADLISRLRAAGVPAVVSGAGPSVLAFAGADDDLGKLDSISRGTGIDWRISRLDIEQQGASVTSGVQSVR